MSKKLIEHPCVKMCVPNIGNTTVNESQDLCAHRAYDPSERTHKNFKKQRGKDNNHNFVKVIMETNGERLWRRRAGGEEMESCVR